MKRKDQKPTPSLRKVYAQQIRAYGAQRRILRNRQAELEKTLTEVSTQIQIEEDRFDYYWELFEKSLSL